MTADELDHLFRLTNAEILLMAGELTAGEMRTVRAVMDGLRRRADALSREESASGVAATMGLMKVGEVVEHHRSHGAFVKSVASIQVELPIHTALYAATSATGPRTGPCA